MPYSVEILRGAEKFLGKLCHQIDEDQLLILVITISTRDDVYQVLQRHLGR